MLAVKRYEISIVWQRESKRISWELTNKILGNQWDFLKSWQLVWPRLEEFWFSIDFAVHVNNHSHCRNNYLWTLSQVVYSTAIMRGYLSKTPLSWLLWEDSKRSALSLSKNVNLKATLVQKRKQKTSYQLGFLILKKHYSEN